MGDDNIESFRWLIFGGSWGDELPMVAMYCWKNLCPEREACLEMLIRVNWKK